MDTFKLMLAPIFECLILVGIHSYLGIHVIRRGVIFVDLALAQIAALGTSVGFLLGMAPDSRSAFIYSIIFTFVGAGIFSLTRTRKSTIPQEAIIGLVYAAAAGMAILVIDRAPEGSEHLKEILVGRIVWVRWGEVASAAIAYSLVGIIHIFAGKKFLLISKDPEEAYRKGMNVQLWDFIFFMTFGFVISFSVSVAGVLLVFVFLIVPAMAGVLITQRLSIQLAIGWGMGTVATISGMLISYYANFPSGPTIVVVYALILLLLSAIFYIIKSEEKSTAVKRVSYLTVGSAVSLIILIGIGILLSKFSSHQATATETTHNEEIQSATYKKEKSSVTLQSDDFEDELEKAQTLIEEGKAQEAIKILEPMLSSQDTPPFFKEKANEMLKKAKGLKKLNSSP